MSQALSAFEIFCEPMDERGLAAYVIRTARKIFERTGEISPAAFVLLPSGKTLIVPVDRVIDDRELMHTMLEAMVIACNATAIVQANEAWMALPDPAAVFEDWTVPVSERPDRQEIILVHLETRSGESCMWTTPIVRDEKGSKLGETQETPGATTGRMTGFFEKTRKTTEIDA